MQLKRRPPQILSPNPHAERFRMLGMICIVVLSYWACIFWLWPELSYATIAQPRMAIVLRLPLMILLMLSVYLFRMKFFQLHAAWLMLGACIIPMWISLCLLVSVRAAHALNIKLSLFGFSMPGLPVLPWNERKLVIRQRLIGALAVVIVELVGYFSTKLFSIKSTQTELAFILAYAFSSVVLIELARSHPDLETRRGILITIVTIVPVAAVAMLMPMIF
jgi:hypothetical protein